MNFGEAIKAIRMNEVVRRKGWNGKGMFIYFVPADRYKPCTGPGQWIIDAEGKVPYGAYIALKTAQGYVVPWQPSQSDMVEDDWEVCTDEVRPAHKSDIENSIVGVPEYDEPIMTEPLNLYDIPAEQEEAEALDIAREHDEALQVSHHSTTSPFIDDPEVVSTGSNSDIWFSKE